MVASADNQSGKSEPLAKRLRCLLSPVDLMGIDWGCWWRLLCENRFAVTPRYWPKALATSGCALGNSLLRRWEDWRYDEAIAAVRPAPPVFVLGQARSGTTLLYRWLAEDSRLATPNLFQVRFPHCFLTTERVLGPLTERWVRGKRFQDNVAVGWSMAAEEEYALAVTTLRSPRGAVWFPRSRERYLRYTTLQGLSPAERVRWGACFDRFLRKLTLRHGRRLVLKSPMHMARIGALVPLFPGAVFVHIHRHPYEVLQSRVDMVRRRPGFFRLQHVAEPLPEEQALESYELVNRAFFRDRHLIPPERICHVRYDDLVRDPVAQLGRIYRELALPEFATMAPVFAARAAQVQAYTKNEHEELPDSLKRRLRDRCPEPFVEWGYRP